MPTQHNPDIATWRTPNEWVFVAVCQQCGRVATSMADGGTAIRKCYKLHEREDDEDKEQDWGGGEVKNPPWKG